MAKIKRPGVRLDKLDLFTRKIAFSPAWDKRSSDPKKNYGIHGVEIRWYLTGPKGIVQFVIYSNWMLPNVAMEQRARTITDIRGRSQEDADRLLRVIHEPMGADVGYHSPKKLYKEQTGWADCRLLKAAGLGDKCYYDGSGLAAIDMMEVLLKKGGEAVWKKLEEYYHRTFDNKKETE
jgi:hypothetical protein